ncbi:MAG: aromatic amino acid ammonia-lyase [Bacteroidales bacterium]|jgi:histidine ammonia-lyase|nr:aromatic amino acid ammonia-lyase [Bacteroidales bacterium]MDD4214929.1 aromatic amino acid ammonia-lyase [Bacteroidales bacterium]
MITLGSHDLTLEEIYRIVFHKEEINVSEESLKKVSDCHDFLKEFSEDKVIYGINTGLGPMAPYKIEKENRQKLQYNAIRSHCSGCGEPLPDKYAKAAMLSRLNTQLRGYSGIHPEVIELLTLLINRNISPVIPEHGGVGASGDLVQLAHLALMLIGEGDVWYKGKIMSTHEVFAAEKIKPVSMHIREGLSLINGTSVMTGIGVINLMNAYNLMNWSVFASCLINEIVCSFDDHYSEELNKVKRHKGQEKIAGYMRNVLSDSKLIRKRQEHLYGREFKEEILADKVQEYYSLRCVPQILGPVYDTLVNSEEILVYEFNSVNDNPVIDMENENIFHGGNFHGDYVSLEMDKIKTVITKLSMLAERQLNYLLNPRLNELLPPFVNLGTLGLNFGMQGVQFTATSSVAENQTLSFPNYVHSISCNNDNQDIVSMGTNSAWIAKRVIGNTYDVLAIELITLIQAVDYLKYQERLSGFSRHIYNKLREIVPAFAEDSTKSKDIKAIRKFMQNFRLRPDIKLP